MKLNDYNEALDYLQKQIPQTKQLQFPGTTGLLRMKYFMELLNNPQDNIKVIHIAGTSGKGSTAFILNRLLTAHGYKTGLHLSPHVIDIRERMEINNELISQETFVKYINIIIPVIEKVRSGRYGPLTYFEVMTGMAFYIFAKEKVDYAIIETGMGGLYDATNCVIRKDKIAIITRIGLDHTQILGNNVSKIAEQKAGIIKTNNLVITIKQNPKVNNIFKLTARQKSAKYLEINKSNYSGIVVSPRETSFNYRLDDDEFSKLKLGLPGDYQVENASLAISALLLISRRDNLDLDEIVIRNTLAKLAFPGRMDIHVINNLPLILDGAHNPQKMSSFISTLKKLYPNKKFVFLIACKKNKAIRKMLEYILPVAEKIYVTSFFITNHDLNHLSYDVVHIKLLLNKMEFTQVVMVEKPDEALKQMLKEKAEGYVCTGSFYLLGELYASHML